MLRYGRIDRDVIVQNDGAFGAQRIYIVGFAIDADRPGARGARNGYRVICTAMDGQRVCRIRQAQQLGFGDGQVGLFGKLQVHRFDLEAAKGRVGQINRRIGAFVIQHHIRTVGIARSIR